MSASDQMRAMLDQLMGTQRNGQIFCEKSDSLRWYVIFLIHKSLFPGIEEKMFQFQSQNQPKATFYSWESMRKALSYNRQLVRMYMVVCKRRLYAKRPWYVFLGLSPSVPEGDLRLLPYLQQGTYATIICLQFWCLGTWVKGAKFTKTQKPENTYQCELRIQILKLVLVVFRATCQI